MPCLLQEGRVGYWNGFVVLGFFPTRMGCKQASVSVRSKRFENDIGYQLVVESASRLSSAAGLPQLSLSGSGFVPRFSLDAG